MRLQIRSLRYTSGPRLPLLLDPLRFHHLQPSLESRIHPFLNRSLCRMPNPAPVVHVPKQRFFEPLSRGLPRPKHPKVNLERREPGLLQPLTLIGH